MNSQAAPHAGISPSAPGKDCELSDGSVPTVVARVHPSISMISPDDWLTLSNSADHSWDYYAAGERMHARGFTLGAIAAYADGMLVGAAPMFHVNYRVDAPLGQQFKPVGDWIHRHAPSLVTMPILGLGSPIADECQIRLKPGLTEEGKREILAAMLASLAAHAAESRVKILVLKDITAIDNGWAQPALHAAGFTTIPSLPVAILDLPFADFEAYLMSLKPKMRRNVRAKLRQSAHVRAEFRTSLAGLEDEATRLYAQTRANRKASYDSFDELPDGYFQEVMAGMGGSGKAGILTLWVDDKLACFSLFTIEGDRVVGRYLGMDYTLVRDHNLYFMNWLTMVRYCIDHGYPTLQAGQTSYALKVRLGSKLHRSFVYFKHTGMFTGRLFKALAPLAAFDTIDPDLRELGADAPYADSAR